MGCTTSVIPSPSLPRATTRGPLSTQARPPTRRARMVGSLLARYRRRGKRFTREQRQLIKKYLPSIAIYEHSTPAHLAIAAQHWGQVYREGSLSGTSNISKGSWGRDSNKPQTNTIRDLYDSFYAYLGEHSPELMPVFRASMHVRSKVLVHISAGMRSLLGTADVAAKLVQLTQTHLRVGVKLEHFDALAKALFHAFQVTSGPAYWTPDVAEAWRRLFVHCSAMLMVEQKRAMQQAIKSAKSNGNILHNPVMSDLYPPSVHASIRETNEPSNSVVPSKTSFGRQK